MVDSVGEEGEERSRDRSRRGVEMTVSLETSSQVQCGDDLGRQCWDTGTYSSSLEQPEPAGVFPTDRFSWLEMASSGRSYGNSNVMLVRNESSTDMSIVATLASCSPVTLQVQLGGRSLEDAVVNCGQKRSYYSMFKTSGEDPGEEDLGDDYMHQIEKKRRLTFDQVGSLEKNFEIENKLEPERKIQLANELGLQPRQVAVWFQNRRARWKIKQLERDYEVLSSDFNRLKEDYDAVLQEKEELEGQRACLTENMQTEAADALEKTSKKSKPSTKLSPLKTCEGILKTETRSELDANTLDGLTPRQAKGAKETSSKSISSELQNADSPRASIDTESGAVLPLDNVGNYSHISAELIDASIVHMNDHAGDQLLPLHACQGISNKHEDGSFQDDYCNDMLAQLEAERGLPWWNWP